MKVHSLDKHERHTNKKLLYATILLELAAQQKEQHYVDALEISCLVQLNSAYYCFIEELQRRLNITPQYGYDASQLVDAMRNNNIHSAEVETLARLETESSSWIFAMQSAHKKLSRNISLSSVQLISDNEINRHQSQPLTILSSSQPLPQHNSQLSKWIKEMESLFDDMRGALTEY